MDSLPFHPLTALWFAQRVGVPTEVQAEAWPALATGGHVLVTAPTGTGKTLAAFLGALNNLLTGTWPSGQLRVLYLSPLKALNTDVERNLLLPLAELRSAFEASKTSVPRVRVMVRSGDTPEDERRRLRKNPPEILITTPESLNILLVQKGSSQLFSGVKVVIADEIHAILGSKRGTSLLLGLERLVAIAGEFQRVGLSATVNPPGLVARALGGQRPDGLQRAVAVVSVPSAKDYEVQVAIPQVHKEDESGKVFWESLAFELRRRTRERTSTLIFVNSRRACEKLARLMNEKPLSPEPPPGPTGETTPILAYAHHGSLSKEIRREVEQRLKAGDLKALVATSSLELGIDIGDLDEVILAETPRTASSAIQKVGRAGHRTGEVSRARLYPSHGTDLVEAAVVVRCIKQQTVEPLVIPEGPLDVLAQALLSAWCAQPAAPDALFALVRGSWPYRNLGRTSFDLVVDMLAGRYEGTRIRELKPRIFHDPVTGLWSATEGVAFLLHSSGGTIPDRGQFSLRDQRTGALIGELDEEFVWERAVGDRFALGAQVWKITSMDDQSVRVEPVQAPPHIIPFWKAEDQDRGWFLAEKIGLFLMEADQALEADTEAWRTRLIREDGFSPEAADHLVTTLTREKRALGALPHRWRLVVEQVQPETSDRDDGGENLEYILHTFWGARVNRPWAFALAQAWEDQFGYAIEAYPGDDQVLLLVPPETPIEVVVSLVTAANLEDLLRRRLEATGYFGARFREGAGRALLLPKTGFMKRSPLWKTRLRSKRLFEAVSRFSDFPIVLEAWRQCLHDEFDLDALKLVLDERAAGRIATWYAKTSVPSPFTEGILWRHVNEKMYAGDDPPARKSSSLEPGLWSELLASERPRIPRDLVLDWEARWGRTAPGYAPETPRELEDLLELRIALSPVEWDELLEACSRDSGRPRQFWEDCVETVQTQGRVGVPAVARQWGEPEQLWSRWLEGRGPVAIETLAGFWNVPLEGATAWVGRMEEKGLLVSGLLTEDARGTEVCLVSTWEQLVRRMRLVKRALAPTRALADLPYNLALRQGLIQPELAAGSLEGVLGLLLGLPVSAALWEAVVLPSRVRPYRSADFDALFADGGLHWFGAGDEKVTLGFAEDAGCRHLSTASEPSPEAQRVLDALPPGTTLPVAELSSRASLALGPLTKELWNLAWSGHVSATTFGPLRHGIRTGFRFDSGKVHEPSGSPRNGVGFQRWSAARNTAGSWHRWKPLSPAGPQTSDNSPLAALEELKRRARLVLDRYGIVFRALLSHEAPNWQWRALFPAFRLMELSGEIVGGLFWEGLPGLQFATPQALRDLAAGQGEPQEWIQHAQDPSSLCGLGIETLAFLPRRAAGTWLWWRGSDLVGAVTSNGKTLELNLEPTRPLLERMAELLFADGRTNWTVETIAGTPAVEHAWAALLVENGFRPHGEKLILWRT